MHFKTDDAIFVFDMRQAQEVLYGCVFCFFTVPTQYLFDTNDKTNVAVSDVRQEIAPWTKSALCLDSAPQSLPCLFAAPGRRTAVIIARAAGAVGPYVMDIGAMLLANGSAFDALRTHRAYRQIAADLRAAGLQYVLLPLSFSLSVCLSAPCYVCLVGVPILFALVPALVLSKSGNDSHFPHGPHQLARVDGTRDPRRLGTPLHAN